MSRRAQIWIGAGLACLVALVVCAAVYDQVGTFLNNISGIITAVFTIGLFIATYLLYRATDVLAVGTRKLVEGGEITAERQLRPWVFVGSNQWKNENPDEKKVVLHVVNYGNSPAVIREVWFRHSVGPPVGNTRDESGVNCKDETFLLGRPDQFIHPAKFLVPRVTKYVMGWVVYADTLKPHGRRTWFCIELLDDIDANGRNCRPYPNRAWNEFE